MRLRCTQKGFYKAFVEAAKQSDIYFLAHECIKRSGETIKPYGEGFIETLVSVEVLDSDSNLG